MKLKFTYLIFLFISTVNIYGQINTGQLPKSFKLKDIIESKPMSFNININELLAKSPSKNDSSLLVAVPLVVDKDFINSSTLMYSDKNCNIYQMTFQSKEATSLGIYFSAFFLPQGYELHAYNRSKTDVIGAFTYLNNNPTKRFAISPVAGDNLVLELYEPKVRKTDEIPILKINKLSHHFRENLKNNLLKRQRPNSVNIDNENCYLDVHCELNYGRERGVFL